MDNKEIFRVIVFNVTREIASSFPGYAKFEYEDLLPEAMCTDERMRQEYCLNTIKWLKDNAYLQLNSEELPVHGWEMVLPTEKMTTLMNIEMPHAKKTFSAAVLETTKNVTIGAIQDVMKEGMLAAVKHAPYFVTFFMP